MNFSQRSYQKELLDADHIPFADIRQNMKELDTINRLLGGHAITVQGFKNILGNRRTATVCEIGCGGGDNLAAIVGWCRNNKIAIACTGIDIKPECIAVARDRPDINGIGSWIAEDYAEVKFEEKPDIIFSSLFCHHFTHEQLIRQLNWMNENSKLGFFINDLHRHWLAYHSISMLTKLFSSSYLVKNDAPLSVARGFRRNDWDKLFAETGINNAVMRWRWAFRYLITVTHGYA